MPPGGNFAPPPGYVPYGPAGQRGFQPIGPVSKWLGILLVASAVGSVLTVLAQIPMRGEENTSFSFDRLDAGFALSLLTSLAVGAVSIAALVLQVVFAYRIAKNLQVLGRTGASFSPGACIAVVILGGCTAGILPYFMWRELWAGSDPSVPAHSPNWKVARAGDILVINLVLTVLSTVVGLSTGVGSVISRLNTDSSSFSDRADTSIWWLMVVGLVSAAATVTLMLLVRQLSARHMQATREA